MRRQSTITFAIRGPLGRSDLPGLSKRACAELARAAGGVVVCEVQGIAADAVAVDALARLALVARRNRCQIRFRGASQELRELVALIGLDEVISG